MTLVAAVGISLNDIDFLASPSFATPRFIYRYRSGILKAKVQAVLEALAGENGRMPVSASPDQFRISQAGEGFFKTFVISYWINTKPAADQCLLETLTISGGNPFVVFVPVTAAINAELEVKAASSSCVVIEEQPISAGTMLPYLNYLHRVSDLGAPADLLRSDVFIDHLLARLDGQLWDLPQLIHEFDRAVVLHTDSQGRFIRERFDEDDELSAGGQIGRSLRSLLEKPQESALFALLRGLERRYRKDAPPKELIASLSRITVNVLTERVGADSAWRPEPALWSSLIILASPRLAAMPNLTSGDPYAADLFLVDVSQLGMLFVDRCDQSVSADPMHGLWPQFSKIWDSHRRPSWLKDLFAALIVYLGERPIGEFPWIERLAHSLVEPLRSQQKRRNAPQSLQDIVGNCTVIKRIAKRYLIDGICKPLILSGPLGVGKFAVARAIARSFICEEPLANGMPCEACGTCGDNFGGFGVIEIDAREHDASVLSIVRDALDKPTFADHRVVIVENADAATSLDAFLKIMEAERVSVTFILCTTNLQKLGGTIRSRSVEFVLRELQPSETRRLAIQFLADGGQHPACDQTLDILVTLSANLPGRLVALCEKLGNGSATVPSAYDALDIRWGDWACEYWMWMMKAGSRPQIEPLVPVSVAVERLRHVLLYLGVVPGELPIPHPAIEIVSLTSKASLCMVWQTRCQRLSRSLWFDLANFWLDDTPTEDFGFRELVSKTRRYF